MSAVFYSRSLFKSFCHTLKLQNINNLLLNQNTLAFSTLAQVQCNSILNKSRRSGGAHLTNRMFTFEIEVEQQRQWKTAQYPG